MDQQKNTLKKKDKTIKKVDLEHILFFLKTENIPPDEIYKDKQKRFHFKQRAADFIVENGKLYYIRPRTSFREVQRTPTRRLVLFSNKDKLQAFYESHIGSNGEHNGKNKTSNNLAEKYYVYSLNDMVDVLIKNCNVCCERLRRTDRKNDNDIQILNQIYGENNFNRLLTNYDKSVVNGSSTHIGNEMCLEHQNDLEQYNATIIVKENLQSEGDNDKILQQNIDDQDDIRVKSDEVMDQISSKCDKDQDVMRGKSYEVQDHISKRDEDQDVMQGKSDEVQDHISKFDEDQDDIRGKCNIDQCMNENDVRRKYTKKINIQNDLVEDNIYIDVTAQEPDHFWYSVELCVFGPYGYWDSKKFVLVFLDLYSMWPEVMVVDTVSPTIVTMGLLNLVCRYNIMKNLYLRDNNEIPFSLFKPNVQLLKSADLDIDIIPRKVDNTDDIWTSMRDHVSTFISNNIDWPSSLSFALIPLRMTVDEGGSYSLLINNKRQETNEAELKRRFSSFESTQQKLLKAYRSCTSTSSTIDLSNLDITKNPRTNDIAVMGFGVDVNVEETNHGIENVFSTTVSDRCKTNSVSAELRLSDCNDDNNTIVSQHCENMEGMNGEIDKAVINCKRRANSGRRKVKSASLVKSGSDCNYVRVKRRGRNRRKNSYVFNDNLSKQANNISERLDIHTGNNKTVSIIRSNHTDLTENAADKPIKPRNTGDIAETILTCTENTEKVSTRKSIYSNLTDNAKDVSIKQRNKVDIDETVSKSTENTEAGGRGSSIFKMRTRSSTKQLVINSNRENTDKTVDLYKSRKRLYLFDNNETDKNVNISPRKKFKSDIKYVNSSRSVDTQNIDGGDDKMYDLENSETNEISKCVTRSKEENCDTKKISKCVTRSKERNDIQNDNTLGINGKPQSVTTPKEGIESESQTVGCDLQNCVIIKEESICQDNAQGICGIMKEEPVCQNNEQGGETKIQQLQEKQIISSDLRCAICELTFKNSAEHKYHMKSHRETQRVKCSKCGKLFRHRNALKFHEDKVHSNNTESTSEIPLPCNVCGKEFKTCAQLKSHKRYHKNHDKFICNICGKTVKKLSMESHLKLHTNTNRLECQYCFRGFFSTDSLTAHINYKHHHKRPQAECPFCKKKYTRKDSMNRHVRAQHLHQKPFMCEKCGKVFYRKQYLQTHQITCKSSEDGVPILLDSKTVRNMAGFTGHNVNIKPKPEDGVLLEPKTVSVKSDINMEGFTGHNVNIKPRPETSKETDEISEIEGENDNVLGKTDVLIQEGNEIENVLIPNENQIVLEMRDDSELQDVSHCVMYESESGVQYHILLDTPEDGLNNETIAALEMLSQIEATQ